MFKKKILAAIAAGLIALGSFGVTKTASRAEIAAFNVQTAAGFPFWDENSPTKKTII